MPRVFDRPRHLAGYLDRREAAVILDKVAGRFVGESLVSAMAPDALEDVPPPPAVDALPEDTERRYTRSLLFSDVVDLMATIVCKGRPSIKVAYKSTHGPWESPGRLSARRSIGRDRTVST
jgi:hypothetical protein